MSRTITVPDWATIAPRLQSLALVATICVVAWLVRQHRAAPVVPPRSVPVAPVVPSPPPDPVRPPDPVPPPSGTRPPLVAAAAAYHDTFGAHFAEIGDRVASGELADQRAILAAMRANVAPFSRALTDAIGAACSADGEVRDGDGLADLFRQVGDAVKGGGR